MALGDIIAAKMSAAPKSAPKKAAPKKASAVGKGGKSGAQGGTGGKGAKGGTETGPSVGWLAAVPFPPARTGIHVAA